VDHSSRRISREEGENFELHRDRDRDYGKSRLSDNALVIMLLGVAALLVRSTALIMSTKKERERERERQIKSLTLNSNPNA